MKHYRIFILTAAIMSMALFYGCQTTRPSATVEQPPAVEKKPALPIEQQEQLATKTFNDMLDMTGEQPRKEVLPQLVAGYQKIIEEAPDTYLAEESHLRLIIHYFEDPETPQVEKAEEVYRQYFERYKNPKLGPGINATMARLYYNYKMWDRLASFMVPFVKQYVETGKIADKLYLFYYSESKFQLKEYVEAARGYRLMIRENPPGMELDFARRRLVEIRHLADPNIKNIKKEQ